MKEVLKYLGAFIFAILLLAKASAFHVYEHQDTPEGNDTHCEYCLIAIDSQQADFIPVSQDIFEDKIMPSTHQDVISSFDFQVSLSPFKTEQLPRPPPAVL